MLGSDINERRSDQEMLNIACGIRGSFKKKWNT